MRILIVEDEIRLAEALGQIMEENNTRRISCTTERPASITHSAGSTM